MNIYYTKYSWMWQEMGLKNPSVEIEVYALLYSLAFSGKGGSTGNTGKVTIQYSRISEMLGITRVAAMTAIKRLCGRTMIVKENRGVNQYHIYAYTGKQNLLTGKKYLPQEVKSIYLQESTEFTLGGKQNLLPTSNKLVNNIINNNSKQLDKEDKEESPKEFHRMNPFEKVDYAFGKILVSDAWKLARKSYGLTDEERVKEIVESFRTDCKTQELHQDMMIEDAYIREVQRHMINYVKSKYAAKDSEKDVKVYKPKDDLLQRIYAEAANK